jgi:hypothetical protein
VKLIKEIVFECGQVQLYEPRHIRIGFFPKQVIGRAECIDVNNALAELSGHEEILVMTLAAEDTIFNAEAREESAGEAGMRYTLADAFVAKTLAQKLMVNFYLKFNKPGKPSKAFSSEEDALSWLFSYAWNSKSLA